MAVQIPLWNGIIGLVFPVLLFYGVAACLQGHVIAHFCKTPLAAFMYALAWTMLGYAVVAISFAVGATFGDPSDIQSISTATTFGLNLLFPIGNVMRLLFVGFNLNAVACENGTVRRPGTIYGEGGPILYLIIQIGVFLALLVWLEQTHSRRNLFRRRRLAPDAEKKPGIVASEEVEKECARVETEESDLLRVRHLTKSFGSNVAVDDITLGLGESEVMALLGPNGAGKSTFVNLIRADLQPDAGEAYLCGENAYTTSAQKYLGGKLSRWDYSTTVVRPC